MTHKISKRTRNYRIGVAIRYVLLVSAAIFMIIEGQEIKPYDTTLFYVLSGMGLLLIGMSIFGFLENMDILKTWFPNWYKPKTKK